LAKNAVGKKPRESLAPGGNVPPEVRISVREGVCHVNDVIVIGEVDLKLERCALIGRKIFGGAICVAAAAPKPGDIVAGGVFAGINENFRAAGEDTAQFVKTGDVELIADVASNVCDLEIEPLAGFASVRVVFEHQMVGILVQQIGIEEIAAFKPGIEAENAIRRRAPRRK
jgi:hypothetical protein